MEHFYSVNSSEQLFVLLHGTGGNEFSLLFLTGELDPEASLISFLGDHGVAENRRFFPALENGQLEQAGFEQAVANFLSEWDRLALSYSKVTLIGYSNGANLIQGILQKRPAIANQVILLHPQEFNFEFGSALKIESRVLLTTGANDSLVIPGEILALSKRLERQFTEVDLVILDGEHGVTDEEVAKVKLWYQNNGETK